MAKWSAVRLLSVVLPLVIVAVLGLAIKPLSCDEERDTVANERDIPLADGAKTQHKHVIGEASRSVVVTDVQVQIETTKKCASSIKHRVELTFCSKEWYQTEAAGDQLNKRLELDCNDDSELAVIVTNDTPDSWWSDCPLNYNIVVSHENCDVEKSGILVVVLAMMAAVAVAYSYARLTDP
jgi:hypothetical protein